MKLHSGLTPVGLTMAQLRGDGKFGKKTVVRGIQMRSKLEADFARHLDQLWVAWEYEPHPFFARGRGYLPDFWLLLGDRPCYVEIKPTILQAELAQKRMEVIWETEPDAFLVVASGEQCRWYGANRPGPWVSWVERWAHT